MNDLDAKLFKKCINYLLDGNRLYIQDKVYGYFRKDDVIEEDEQAFQVLENGIFRRHTSDGYGHPQEIHWIRVCELDQVDYLYGGWDGKFTDEQKEELFLGLCFTLVMKKEHSR
ncbi:MAG: hypothetical protein JWP44_5027 [Mucilaginibacter sp.]|nr:hypothetical protein [Mucilaginibacter sp.]